MNSRGREWLLRYWDFPLFMTALDRHGISLEGKRILDAGCGSGYTLGLIWTTFRPAALDGFDLVPSQVEAARSRGVPANVFVADITSLEIQNDSYDAVFVCGVLHHCRAWRRGLAEVARVLRAGGVLLLEEPDVAHLKFERILTGRSPALESGFSLHALRAELRANGLYSLSQRPLYFGLFGSLVCVKGVAAVGDYYSARRLRRAVDAGSLTQGHQAPA
ncbi:MAG: class I SAM-dependent methyltransferase [Dehalococcoidia bacterium]|nr:class I SAM-dependent methyltransferase [Dehalococcoidia bacterium]